MYGKIIDTLLKLGKEQADDIEVLISRENSFSLRVYDQQVEAFNYSDSQGLGVRVVVDGKVGVGYTEDFSDEALRSTVKEAAACARINEKAERVELADYPAVDTDLNLYNEALNDVTVERKVDLLKRIDRTTRGLDKRIINVPYCMYGDSRHQMLIANSRGMNKEFRMNGAHAFVSPLAEENDEKRNAHAFTITRDFAAFDADKLSAEAVRNTIDLLGGHAFDPGEYPVVFNGEAMASLLSTFAGIFSAKQVQEGRSLLQGKLGQVIANERVTIVDDALHPDGLSSRPFDSEGYPSQRTLLVDGGTLRTYLHNTVTASRDGVRSTGNGARGYSSDLSVSPSNMYLAPGAVDRQQLMRSHPRVIEIVSLAGLHSGANPISGDFSLSGEGYMWENGVRLHSLQIFTVSGNIVDLLKRVGGIANDFQFQISAFGSASTLVEGLSFSS